MKSFRDYLKETKETFDRPARGDEFAINIREECLIETHIVGETSDGVVLYADDRMMQLLEAYGYVSEGAVKDALIDAAETMDLMQFVEYCRGQASADEAKEIWLTVNDADSEGHTIHECGVAEETCMECGLHECGCGDTGDGQMLDPGEYDQEGAAAKSDLNTIVDAARRLQSLLGDADNMPEWTQSKIDRAADYVDTAADYIGSQKERGVMEQGVAEDSDAASIRERIASLQRDLRAVTGNYPGDDRNRMILRRQIFDLKAQLKAAGGKKSDVEEGAVPGRGAEQPTIPEREKWIENLISLHASGNLTDAGRAKLAQRIAKAQHNLAMKKQQQQKSGVSEGSGEPSPVARAILHRIMMQHTGLLAAHGPERVMAAVDEVVDYIGDVEEIGSSDVSGWVRHVEQMLTNMPDSQELDESMAQRLVASDSEGAFGYRVYLDREWNEYVVKHYVNGRHQVDADYHTDDKNDAMSTAQKFVATGGRDYVQGLDEGSYNDSDEDFDDYNDDDEEIERNSFYVIIASETSGAFVGTVIKAGSKWQESSGVGKSPYNWGGNYMGYLTPDEVVRWIRKDYRNYEVDGPYFDKDEAKSMAQSLSEAEYQGRDVPLNKPMQGDVKKSKVYVKDPKTGNVKKVNFGDPNMTIKKSNPERRKSFRARHNCDNPGPKTSARYWSCRAW